MRWPPYLLKMTVKNMDHDFNLWFPLFLIWPIVLVLSLLIFIILLFSALLILIFTWQFGWIKSVVESVPAVLRLLGNLPGLLVDVDGKDGKVYLEFI